MAPAKSGYRVALTDDPGLARLCKRLDERATAEKAGLVDQSRAIREVPPREKIGASLSRRPLPEEGARVRGRGDMEDVEDERLSGFMGACRQWSARAAGASLAVCNLRLACRDGRTPAAAGG